MNRKVIDAVVGNFPCVKWVDKLIDGVPGEGWFLLELNPLPPLGEFAQVVADIDYDQSLWVAGNGQVRHLNNCKEQHDLPSDFSLIQRAIDNIKPRTFKLAIHPGIPGFMHGQPLAICLDPIINYEQFPDHPHLNASGNYDTGWFYPDSLCYTDDIPGLGTKMADRMESAIMLIAIWLLRHMLWEETRKHRMQGIWIGPQAEGLKPSEYLFLLNPEGSCRCGQRRAYQRCHMMGDKNSHRSEWILSARGNNSNELLDKLDYIARWKNLRKIPQDHSYISLRDLSS